MEAASRKLLSSGAHYNEEIMAAMVYFVGQVDNEIRKEMETLQLVAQSSCRLNHLFVNISNTFSRSVLMKSKSILV